MEAQARGDININIDEIAKLKLLRQRKKKVTIEKDSRTTKFIIHDLNFENIDDWDLFNQEDSSNSISDEPLNPNLAEKSIRDIINLRKESLTKRLSQLKKIPISEHHRSANMGASMSS